MQENENAPFTVGVLGGGIGGVMVALLLAEEISSLKEIFGREKKLLIQIFEKSVELLRGSSDRTPGRMGLGFHYVDVNTAITYLHATIEWVKRFKAENPELRIGEQQAEEHYLRRGRYFIVKQHEDRQKNKSLFNADKILATYKKIQQEYARLVAEDPANKVFGEPETFFRVLREEEYADDVNMAEVEVGVETAEHLLDWPKFREFLLQKVEKSRYIQVLSSTPVQDLGYDYKKGKYNIISNQKEYVVDYIINATWEYVAYFNRKALFFDPPGREDARNQENIRTNRLKALAVVELPKKLENVNSMFFCMGPFCMFSNMGKNSEGKAIGYMTYAPETNRVNSTELCPSEEYLKYLNGEVSQEEKNIIGQKIIAGVSQYIPAMQDATLLKVNFGTVQTIGDVDIFSPDSKFHIRDYYGIEEKEIGFVSNACMKLLYGWENAKKILQIFKMHLLAIGKIDDFIKNMNVNILTKHIIALYLRKVDANELIKQTEKVQLSVLNKFALNAEIRSAGGVSFFENSILDSSFSRRMPK